MIKVCELITRRAGMKLTDFREHWLNRHGPLVARLPGLERYTQSHPLLGGYRKGPLSFDGVAELWVRDKETLRAFPKLPEFQAAKEDEPRFIDTERLIELVVDEHVIVDGPQPVDGIKSVAFMQFRQDLDPRDAQAYWRDTHGPIAAAIPGLRRYVQSHVRGGAYTGNRRPPIDGVAVAWFSSLDDMRHAATTTQYARTRSDEAHFLLATRPTSVLTREHVLVQ